MKRAFLIPLIVLLLATMSCSLSGTKPTAAPVEPTKAVIAPDKPTEPPAEPAAQPTDTEAAPAEANPTEAAPTEEAAPTDATEIKDTFDRQTSNWSDPLVVTTQAAGRDPRIKVTSGTGFLRFAISDKETYVYQFFKKAPEGASTIEADFQLKGALNTGIALVCKANEDHTSWFEVRVSAWDNSYHFYQYDKKRKDVEDKNPYVELGKGHMKIDQYFPTKPNHVVFTCTDSELSVDVNNGKAKGSQTLDNPLDGTVLGLAVMSADVLPGTVDFDTVVIR